MMLRYSTNVKRREWTFTSNRVLLMHEACSHHFKHGCQVWEMNQNYSQILLMYIYIPGALELGSSLPTHLPFRGMFDESLVVGDRRYQRWKIQENPLIHPGKISNKLCQFLFNTITLNQGGQVISLNMCMHCHDLPGQQ